MKILRKAALMILGITFVMGAVSCARTTQDVTVERHVVGEEFIVE